MTSDAGNGREGPPEEAPPARRRRLHPAAVGAEAVDALRGIVVPLVVLVVVGGGLNSAGRVLFYGVAGLVITLARALAQWQTTLWWVDEQQVGLRRGVLSETITTIPLDRIQAIDTARGPIQRLFGVVRLDVQTAGGGRAGEIVLKAVTPADAAELRSHVKGADQAGRASAAAPRPTAVWVLGTRRLLVAAVTSGSLGVVVPVVAGASQLLGDVLDQRQAQRLVPTTWHGVVLLALAVLGAAWLLSMLGTVVAFGGFRVTRDGARLRIVRGIVERREASVPVARVHAVRIVEGPLREPFGLAQVRIETAGYAREQATAQTLLPLVRRRDVPAVLHALMPEVAAPVEELEPLPRRAARRFLVRPLALAVVLAAGAVVAFGAAGLAALALVPLAALLGVARFRAAGWRVDGDRVVLRWRRLARTTAAADARRLQAIQTSATPFQRRGRLATLAISVSSGRRFAVPHLDAATAAELGAQLAATAVAGVTGPAPQRAAGPPR